MDADNFDKTLEAFRRQLPFRPFTVALVNGDRFEVEMTLTTPGCPVSEQLPQEALAALVEALPELEVDLQIVWEPPWTPDRLTPEAMELLGFRPR